MSLERGFDVTPMDPIETGTVRSSLILVRGARKALRWIEANPERVLAVGLLYLLGEHLVHRDQDKR
jgi:hypothetical protein